MQNMSETLGNNLAIGDCNLDEISQITDDDLIYIPDKVTEFLFMKVF